MTNRRPEPTDILIFGAGSIMDIGGKRRRRKRARSAEEALFSDWLAIGGDFNVALDVVSETLPAVRREHDLSAR